MLHADLTRPNFVSHPRHMVFRKTESLSFRAHELYPNLKIDSFLLQPCNGVSPRDVPFDDSRWPAGRSLSLARPAREARRVEGGRIFPLPRLLKPGNQGLHTYELCTNLSDDHTEEGHDCYLSHFSGSKRSLGKCDKRDKMTKKKVEVKCQLKTGTFQCPRLKQEELTIFQTKTKIIVSIFNATQNKKSFLTAVSVNSILIAHIKVYITH